MTQKQLEREARKLYRRVYDKTVVCGHEYAQREAEKAYRQYVSFFSSWLTQPAEPVSNTNKLTQFVPDWSKAPEWANWCAQDENGDVWWYQNKPLAGVYVWVHEGDSMETGSFAPPANWKNAIWQRSKNSEQ